MAKKTTTKTTQPEPKNWSFQNWNWTKWILGAKRSIIAMIGILLTMGSNISPDTAYVIAASGITADRLFAIIEYFVKKK